MDNLSNFSNFTSPYPLNNPGFVVFNVVMLLGVVFPVIAVNTVILVALVLDPFIVNVIRMMLGSILVSCLLFALGLAMYHIAGIILYLSPVNNPPTAPCTITVSLIGIGGGARLLFMATFAVVVYIIVMYGKNHKKRFVVASFIAVVVLWILAFLGNSPLLAQEIISTWYAGYFSNGNICLYIHWAVFSQLWSRSSFCHSHNPSHHVLLHKASYCQRHQTEEEYS